MNFHNTYGINYRIEIRINNQSNHIKKIVTFAGNIKNEY